MKVLVLGGSGFIGSHVVDGLLRQQHAVRVFDRQPERFRAPLPGVDYRFGSFFDRMALIDALAGMEVVLHLISSTFPVTAELDPRADVQDNLAGTLTLLESMQGLGIRRLVFLSSGGTVYGLPDTVPIPESHALRPISSYGIVKAAIEHYIEMYRRTGGLSPAIIRPSNPYGPRQSHTGVQGVISTFLRRVRAGEPIEVWGDGRVLRDYIHVADLAELCAVAAGSTVEGTFNAGSGIGVSVNEIVAHVARVTGVPVRPLYRPGRATDVPQSVLDARRAEQIFGWRARIGLAQGMSETWAWLKDQD